jgi:hypothetical protein
MGEFASGSALRTRGLVSFLGMLWALLEISIHRECCLVLAFLQGTGRGFKLGQILLSGFIICSVIGEVWLLFTLQMPAQLSPFLEDVLTHAGCVVTPASVSCAHGLCSTPARLGLLQGPLWSLPLQLRGTFLCLCDPWLLPSASATMAATISTQTLLH